MGKSYNNVITLTELFSGEITHNWKKPIVQ